MGKKANSQRGEHELVLGGKSYVLRPSHAAMVAIEEETGKATLGLVRLGRAGELSLAQLGTIAAELIRAGADEGDSMTRSVSAEKIGEMIFESGLPVAQTTLTMCLLDAATGGRTVTGEAKAAPAKTKSRPAGAA